MRNPPPCEKVSSIVQALGNIYGANNAGRTFWALLEKIFLAYRWVVSRLELASFFFYHDSILVALAGTHVRDIFMGYDPMDAKLLDSISRIVKQINMTEEIPPFCHCGRAYEQLEDGSIIITMVPAISAVKTVQIPKVRKSQPEAR